MQELVPRFLPWARQLVALLPQLLPSGPCFVAGCGPGDELLLLSAALPGRCIVGVDLAPGMTRLAQQRVAADGLAPTVSVQVGSAQLASLAALQQPLSARTQTGDATHVPPRLKPSLVFTCFTLQQMPDPCAALDGWLRALAPGGVLAGELEVPSPWPQSQSSVWQWS